MRQSPLPEPGPTSVKSARVTAIRRLANRSFRQKAGRFLVEGPQAVGAAIRSTPEAVDEVFVTDGDPVEDVARAAAEAGVRVTRVEPRVLLAMTETVHPQGVAAVASFIDTTADAIVARSRLAVLLDGVADPGNAGTILRTADAVGAGGVIFSSGSVDPYNGKCVRSTAGSLFHVPFALASDVADCVERAREHGLSILAATPRGDAPLYDDQVAQSLQGPVLWIFGSEAHGISPDAVERADIRVAIPMPGHAESLNLAVAAAVCLYAGVRERARPARS